MGVVGLWFCFLAYFLGAVGAGSSCPHLEPLAWDGSPPGRALCQGHAGPGGAQGAGQRLRESGGSVGREALGSLCPPGHAAGLGGRLTQSQPQLWESLGDPGEGALGADRALCPGLGMAVQGAQDAGSHRAGACSAWLRGCIVSPEARGDHPVPAGLGGKPGNGGTRKGQDQSWGCSRSLDMLGAWTRETHG